MQGGAFDQENASKRHFETGITKTEKEGIIHQRRRIEIKRSKSASKHDIKKWYEEISKNPWRIIISEKGGRKL